MICFLGIGFGVTFATMLFFGVVFGADLGLGFGDAFVAGVGGRALGVTTGVSEGVGVGS